VFTFQQGINYEKRWKEANVSIDLSNGLEKHRWSVHYKKRFGFGKGFKRKNIL
jgi:hypothetical protein